MFMIIRQLLQMINQMTGYEAVFCLIYHQQVNVPQQSFKTIMWVNAAFSSFNFKLKVNQLKTSLAIGKLMG